MDRVLLDCDPGIDDAVAIIFALKSGRLRIEAITTVSGNLTADRACLNVRKVLELMGVHSIPVAQGMKKPLVRDYPQDPFSHGDDGLGNTNLPDPRLPADPRFAPDVIVEIVNKYPGDISLVATGPLTNIALALMKDPELPKKVKKLIIIGGAFGFNQYAFINATGGNPVSEWNIYVDPEAARLVFHGGFNLVAIGLDVATHPKINMRERDFVALQQASNPESKFVLDIFRFINDRHFPSYCGLIDSMAIAAAIEPSIIKTERIHVDIETRSSLTLGQTVADVRHHFRWDYLPEVEAACSADFERFLDLVIATISAEQPRST
ncbi:nucleoside hydrolase [Moorellaceae bacterium AZ2]